MSSRISMIFSQYLFYFDELHSSLYKQVVSECSHQEMLDQDL
jgi:hypothetical protein